MTHSAPLDHFLLFAVIVVLCCSAALTAVILFALWRQRDRTIRSHAQRYRGLGEP